MGSLKKALSYFKRNGIKKTFYMSVQRLRENQAEKDYEKERINEKATVEMLKLQSEEVFARDIKISLVVPAFETPENFLRELIDSVLCQSYGRFELIIADAGKSDIVENTVKSYSDNRIVYKRLSDNKGIADNTNAAFEYVTGQVTALLDHDDILEPDALYYIAKAFENGASFVYTDEDKVEDIGTKRSCYKYFQANRKPNFDLQLLYSNNYICHLTAIKTDIIKKAGGWDNTFDGAQDFDLFLRCVEIIAGENFNIPKEAIVHIPKVLYHWRVHELSTADNPESKLYAYEAGRKALEAMLKRRHIDGSVSHSEHRGFYNIRYDSIADREAFEFHIPKDCKAVTEDYENIAAGYFLRPEIKAVAFRVLEKDRVSEGPFKGYKCWNSGVMHRAAFGCCTEEIATSAYVINKESKGNLTIYVPEITFMRRKKLTQLKE